MGLFNTAAVRPIVFLPQQVPTFISRGATHHTDARDLYQWRRELLPMNFASKSVIDENSLGSFTCRKAGTWDILFYFPFEGRHTEDFPDTRKIQRLWPGLNLRTRVQVASMLTTRPPKPSYNIKYKQNIVKHNSLSCVSLYSAYILYSIQHNRNVSAESYKRQSRLHP